MDTSQERQAAQVGFGRGLDEARLDDALAAIEAYNADGLLVWGGFGCLWGYAALPRIHREVDLN